MISAASLEIEIRLKEIEQMITSALGCLIACRWRVGMAYMLCRRLWVGFLRAVEAMRRVGDRRHLLHVLVGEEVQTIVERVNSMAFEAGDFASIRTLEYLFMFYSVDRFLVLEQRPSVCVCNLTHGVVKDERFVEHSNCNLRLGKYTH